MKLPNDYDTARAYTGSSGPTLTPGGHICRIRGAKVEQSRNGQDMLVIAFDIADANDQFNGYYANRFSRARQWSDDPKWPGVYRAMVQTSDGHTSGWFKGLITAIEESNTGFNFKAAGCDENKLVGKYVGMNFGSEEYLDRNTNEIKVTVRPQYAVSVQTVREGVEPPKRKEYKGERPAQAQQSEPDMSDELPF